MKEIMTKHCRPEDLVALHYGEFGERQRRALERHLETCKDCRSDLARTERFLDAVKKPQVTVSSADIERFAARVAAARRRKGWRVFGWSAGLAAAAVLAFALTFTPRTTVDPPAPSQMAITVDPELLENLELLRNLELLEYMDEREAVGAQG